MPQKENKMIRQVYSIRDAKAETFNPPWFAVTHGEAERNFQRLTKDQSSMVNQFPEDYDLYHLGEYNDQNGQITTFDTPKHVIKAVILKDR